MKTPTDQMLVGLWWETLPGASARKEGICRAVSWIMQAASQEPNVKFLVAIPTWAKKGFLEVVQDQAIPMDRVELLTQRRSEPLLLRLVAWRFAAQLKGPRPRLIERLRARCQSAMKVLYSGERMQSLLLRLFSTESVVLLVLASIPVVVLAALLVPFAVAVVWLLGKVLHGLEVVSRFILKPFRRMLSALQRWLSGQYVVVLDHERRRLAAKARRRKVDCWICPWPWVQEAAVLPGPRVVSLWDFVPADCPSLHGTQAMLDVRKRCNVLLEKADIVVSNSEYVRRKHAVEYFGVDADKTRVVPITPADLTSRATMFRDRYQTDDRTAAARAIRDYYQSLSSDVAGLDERSLEYLADFPYEETTFLFNSTQHREHKNTLNLLRSFDVLVRQRFLSLKLFTTGRLDLNPAVLGYVQGRQLDLDVIAVPDLPTEILAAFYSAACLTVAPTLFEAGVPIMFSESISVGTPALMSGIPQSREVVPEEHRRRLLFDPHDVDDMVESIAWGLENSEELLEIEQGILAGMTSEPESAMGYRYLQIIEELTADEAR